MIGLRLATQAKRQDNPLGRAQSHTQFRRLAHFGVEAQSGDARHFGLRFPNSARL
jgi:hypothetical protein